MEGPSFTQPVEAANNISPVSSSSLMSNSNTEGSVSLSHQSNSTASYNTNSKPNSLAALQRFQQPIMAGLSSTHGNDNSSPTTCVASNATVSAAQANDSSSNAMVQLWLQKIKQKQQQQNANPASASPAASKSNLDENKKKSSNPKPKRCLTAYNIFFQQQRIKMLSTLPEGAAPQPETPKKKRKRRRGRPPAHGKITFADLGRAIGAKWKAASPSEKDHYLSLAKEDKVRYEREMVAWKMREHQQEQAAGKVQPCPSQLPGYQQTANLHPMVVQPQAQATTVLPQVQVQLRQPQPQVPAPVMMPPAPLMMPPQSSWSSSGLPSFAGLGPLNKAPRVVSDESTRSASTPPVFEFADPFDEDQITWTDTAVDPRPLPPPQQEQLPDTLWEDLEPAAQSSTSEVIWEDLDNSTPCLQGSGGTLMHDASAHSHSSDDCLLAILDPTNISQNIFQPFGEHHQQQSSATPLPQLPMSQLQPQHHHQQQQQQQHVVEQDQQQDWDNLFDDDNGESKGVENSTSRLPPMSINQLAGLMGQDCTSMFVDVMNSCP